TERCTAEWSKSFFYFVTVVDGCATGSENSSTKDLFNDLVGHLLTVVAFQHGTDSFLCGVNATLHTATFRRDKFTIVVQRNIDGVCPDINHACSHIGVMHIEFATRSQHLGVDS